MSKHTPGPWKAINCKIETATDDPWEAEIVAIVSDMMPLNQADSNAQLIAAAPDLLEACKIALPFLEENCIGADRPRIVREAIAKAEGGKA